jgi:ribosomal protein L37E
MEEEGIMGYYCKNVCTMDHNARPALGNQHNRAHHPKCTICVVRMDWAGKYCPCCGAPLSRRTKVKSIALVQRLKHQ